MSTSLLPCFYFLFLFKEFFNFLVSELTVRCGSPSWQPPGRHSLIPSILYRVMCLVGGLGILIRWFMVKIGGNS